MSSELEINEVVQEEITFITSSDKIIYKPSGRYPLTLRDFVNINPHISIGDIVPEKYLNSLGYFKVHKTDRPKGDVVEEQKPELVDGIYYQVFKARPFNEAEIAAQVEDEKRTAVSNKRNEVTAIIDNGLSHTIDDKEIVIQFGERHLAKLGVVYSRAQSIINSGSDEKVIFRTKENENIEIDAIEFIDIYEKCNNRFYELHRKLYEFENQVKKLETKEEVKNFGISTFFDN